VTANGSARGSSEPLFSILSDFGVPADIVLPLPESIRRAGINGPIPKPMGINIDRRHNASVTK
jgi:hypothetical protein